MADPPGHYGRRPIAAPDRRDRRGQEDARLPGDHRARAQSVGYTLTRLSAMVTSVYPSNQATRDQPKGRVNRTDQAADYIPFHVVHARVLAHSMRRHQDARNLQEVLAKLAEQI